MILSNKLSKRRCLENIDIPEAPPRALPKVELMISTLPITLKCSSVPLNEKIIYTLAD